jgi:ankyrin repeat protein
VVEASTAQFNPKVPCVSCHHGMMPLWTLGIARDHGIQVNETLRRTSAVRSYALLRDVDSAIQGTHVVDATIDLGELLAFGPELRVQPSLTTALHARRLASVQREDGHWATFDARPPQSYSRFMVTALNAKTISAYLHESQAAEKARRLAKAEQWLRENQPASTEDASYRLLGLSWTGAGNDCLGSVAVDLAARQNSDGGWPQSPGRPSDAYSTGEALYALKSTGNAAEQNFQKGIAYLLHTQFPDGSWLVKSRLHEVAHISPPKMDSGFPHGEDHIMSMFGTNWAIAALALALPEVKHQSDPELAEVRPEAAPWVETAAFGTLDQLRTVDPNAHTAKGSTALMAAVADPARARLLIERGANPKAVAQSGHSALLTASTYRGTADLIDLLVKAGVPVKPKHKVEFNANPLVEVAFTGDESVARILLEAGGDVQQTTLRLGVVPMTPLKAAVTIESVSVLREFLFHGANPNFVDELPLLSWAAVSNRPEAAKVLLEFGADPGLKDPYGWTPMMHTHGIDHDVNSTEAFIQDAINQQPLTQK